jgi:hypothetical protein
MSEAGRAGEEKLQMLHEVIFDFPALPKNVQKNILLFEGYDADEELTMVRERARDMEEDDLQFDCSKQEHYIGTCNVIALMQI